MNIHSGKVYNIHYIFNSLKTHTCVLQAGFCIGNKGKLYINMNPKGYKDPQILVTINLWIKGVLFNLGVHTNKCTECFDSFKMPPLLTTHL